MRTINFHSLVDDKSNFVVVIRMISGNTIAFYSMTPLKKYISEQENVGFLASLTNRRTFTLKSDPESVKKVRIFKYDPYYMDIGNSDLRIALHEPEAAILSNMGNRYSFFDFGNEKNPNLLIGTTNKESNAVYYEVFQLIFR